MNELSPVSSRPAKNEWVWLCVLLGAALLLNLLTYYMYPAVWMDDVLFSEPAINLDRTGHFTTSVWQLQPANTFWAINSPLYPLSLSLWLRVAGYSLLAVRSFNFLLMTVAAFMVWVVSWRFQLVRKKSVRLIMVGLVLLGYGITFAYRTSRPDICGLITLLALALAFTVKNEYRRSSLVFLCAVISAWIGMQVSVYACFAVFLAKIAFRNVSWRDVLLVGLGAGLGFFSVLAFYKLNGQLSVYMALLRDVATEHIVRAHRPGYLSSVPRRLEFSLASYVQDFSALPLLGAIVIAFFVRRELFNERKAIAFLVSLFFLIPPLFNFTGHFQLYYAELTYVPLVLAFAMVYSQAIATGNKPLLGRAVFPVCALAAAAVGLPLRLAICAGFMRLTARNVQQDVIRAHVRANDVVFSDYSSFFEVKQVAQNVFIPEYSTNFSTMSIEGHDFSPEEKKEITVLVVEPGMIRTLSTYFGGEWKPVSEPFGDQVSLGDFAGVPLLGPHLQHHFQTMQMNRRKLQIFRREDAIPADRASRTDAPSS